MLNIDLMGGTELVTEADCWTLLDTAEYGHLAVATADKPDIFPVNYEVIGQSIVVQTNIGHKFLAALRGEGWVAFEVDRIQETAASGGAWSSTARRAMSATTRCSSRRASLGQGRRPTAWPSTWTPSPAGESVSADSAVRLRQNHRP